MNSKKLDNYNIFNILKSKTYNNNLLTKKLKTYKKNKKILLSKKTSAPIIKPQTSNKNNIYYLRKVDGILKSLANCKCDNINLKLNELKTNNHNNRFLPNKKFKINNKKLTFNNMLKTYIKNISNDNRNFMLANTRDNNNINTRKSLDKILYYKNSIIKKTISDNIKIIKNKKENLNNLFNDLLKIA